MNDDIDDPTGSAEPTSATDPGEVDPDQLQAQLSAIRGAMGLEERYPGQRRLWLVYGSIVGATSILTEALFVVVQRGPSWFYQLAWVLFTLVAGLALWRLATGTPRESPPATAPDWRVLFGTLLVGFVGLTLMAAPLFQRLEPALPPQDLGLLAGAYYYALVVAVAGIGFLVTGNALNAYRIRTRDRRVFYGAGLWMLAFAVAFVQSEFLRTFGYAVFGGLFFAYAVLAYVLLGRSDDTGERGVDPDAYAGTDT